MAVHRAAARSAGFYLLGALLVFAPLVRGGNRPLALLVIELAGLGLAVGSLWVADVRAHLPRALLLALGCLAVLPALQLIPLPATLWAGLPGRMPYAEALDQAHAGAFSGWRAVSLVPMATEAAWLALLAPLAVFVAAVGLPDRQLQALVVLLLGLATGEAVLGLIQYGDGPDSIFRLGNAAMAGNAFGTYANRNHLAGLLEMALPLALALLAATIGHDRRPAQPRRGWRQRLASLASLRVHRAAVYGAAGLAILLGLIFTRSRAGLVLAMLGILLCLLAFSRRLGGGRKYGLMGTFAALGLGLAVEIGLAPVLARFTYGGLLDEGRLAVFSDTLQGIGEFFPLGSGIGTFSAVYPRFQSPEVAGFFVNRAHNDYLEWTLEGGLPVVILLGVLFWFYLRRWPQVWHPGRWTTFRFVQVGAGISLLLMLLHGLVDFNLHIPANAVCFAFLAAVFFHRPQEPVEPIPHAAGNGEAQWPTTVPPENRVNPFAQ